MEDKTEDVERSVSRAETPIETSIGEANHLSWKDVSSSEYETSCERNRSRVQVIAQQSSPRKKGHQGHVTAVEARKPSALTVYTVTVASEATRMCCVQVKIRGQVKSTAINTGTDITIASKGTWEQLGRPDCRPTASTVKCANGEELVKADVPGAMMQSIKSIDMITRILVEVGVPEAKVATVEVATPLSASKVPGAIALESNQVNDVTWEDRSTNQCDVSCEREKSRVHVDSKDAKGKQHKTCECEKSRDLHSQSYKCVAVCAKNEQLEINGTCSFQSGTLGASAEAHTVTTDDVINYPDLNGMLRLLKVRRETIVTGISIKDGKSASPEMEVRTTQAKMASFLCKVKMTKGEMPCNLKWRCDSIGCEDTGQGQEGHHPEGRHEEDRRQAGLEDGPRVQEEREGRRHRHSAMREDRPSKIE